MEALYSHLDGQHSSFLGGDLQVDPAPPLGVVRAAQVRHRVLACLVDVHLTFCRGQKGYILYGIWLVISLWVNLIQKLVLNIKTDLSTGDPGY